MRFSLASAAAALALLSPAALAAPAQSNLVARNNGGKVVTPKVMVISMFTPERAVWLEPMKLVVNHTTPGLSPLFEEIACNTEGSVCIVTTGEAEINAASTISALTLSPKFDLRKTYFLVAGIAGVNPYKGTLGTAAFARFSVQVGLEYELDTRQIPSNWTTGYWALGTAAPGILPKVSDLYGSELFELNTNLMKKAIEVTKHIKLNDSAVAQKWRAQFDFAPANSTPSVIQGDVLTSDVYFAGTLLGESFGNYTALITKNETETYTMTAQEDNATLEAMVRAHKAGLVDYSRIMVLRTASDFDRAPSSGNLTALEAFQGEQGGFVPACQNLVIVGQPLVEHILKNWQGVYKAGIAPQSTGNSSFYGDNFGTIRKGAAMARRSIGRRSGIIV